MCENTKEPLPLREAAPEIFKKSTYVGLVLIKVYALERCNHEATLSFFEVLANGEVTVFDELLFHQAGFLVEFLQTASYTPQHTDSNHMESFYTTFDQIKDRNFDGMIITGAPLDYVRFEKVDYWDEICTIMEWGKKHVHCTLHLCWGAYAALYYFYGLDRDDLPEKLSGVYAHKIVKKTSPLFRGFDDIFYAPQSRAMGIEASQIASVPDLELMAVSDEAGVAIVKTTDSRHFFVTCHPEYDADTLAQEYFRDLNKGMNPSIPANYFPDDNPENPPIVNWRSTGQLLYSNWLNYYVYQTTPYDIRTIE